MMMPGKLVGLLATAAVGGAVVIAVSPMAAAADRAVVTKLVDGDTFDVEIDGRIERIRMLNIDTPETKDPNQPVQCLGPEASAFLASLIPVGTTVKLEYDEERIDRFDRTLAGVFTADGTLVNAEVARAGLGRAVVFGENRRFLPPVQAAQQEAAANGRGLYSPEVTCTVPGQVQAVTEAVAAVPTVTAGAASAELEADASTAAAAVATATALHKIFEGDRRGIVWEAFSSRDQRRFAARVEAAVADARTAEGALRSAARQAKVREAEAARIAAEAEAARIAEQQRAAAEAAAKQARTTAPAQPKAPAAKPAPAPPAGNVYYANCAAARAAGAAPVYAGEPGYSRSLDRDGDGVGCE